jgi:hypothetical protein
VKTVFVIAMENHNWTQPSTTTSPQPIFMNAAAPFIKSLVNGTSGLSGQVAYAKNDLNAGAGVHPSELGSSLRGRVGVGIWPGLTRQWRRRAGGVDCCR